MHDYYFLGDAHETSLSFSLGLDRNVFRDDIALYDLDMKSPVHKVNGVQADTGNWFLANKLRFNVDTSTLCCSVAEALKVLITFRGYEIQFRFTSYMTIIQLVSLLMLTKAFPNTRLL